MSHFCKEFIEISEIQTLQPLVEIGFHQQRFCLRSLFISITRVLQWASGAVGTQIFNKYKIPYLSREHCLFRNI